MRAEDDLERAFEAQLADNIFMGINVWIALLTLRCVGGCLRVGRSARPLAPDIIRGVFFCRTWFA